MEPEAHAARPTLVAAFYQVWKAKLGLSAAPPAAPPSAGPRAAGSRTRWQRARCAVAQAAGAVRHGARVAPAQVDVLYGGTKQGQPPCSSAGGPTQQRGASKWRSFDILQALRKHAKRRPSAQTSRNAGGEPAAGDGALPRAVTRGALALGRLLGVASASTTKSPAGKGTEPMDKTLSNVRTDSCCHTRSSHRCIVTLGAAVPAQPSFSIPRQLVPIVLQLRQAIAWMRSHLRAEALCAHSTYEGLRPGLRTCSLLRLHSAPSEQGVIWRSCEATRTWMRRFKRSIGRSTRCQRLTRARQAETPWLHPMTQACRSRCQEAPRRCRTLWRASLRCSKGVSSLCAPTVQRLNVADPASTRHPELVIFKGCAHCGELARRCPRVLVQASSERHQPATTSVSVLWWQLLNQDVRDEQARG